MQNRADASTDARATANAETVSVAPPCAMVIFGAGADLTKPLVAPALYNLVTAKRCCKASKWVFLTLCGSGSICVIAAGVKRQHPCT
jgi:hypothetical protein